MRFTIQRNVRTATRIIVREITISFQSGKLLSLSFQLNAIIETLSLLIMMPMMVQKDVNLIRPTDLFRNPMAKRKHGKRTKIIISTKNH